MDSGNGAFAQALWRRLVACGIAYQYGCFDTELEQINGKGLGFTCRYMDTQRLFVLEHEHLENTFHFRAKFRCKARDVARARAVGLQPRDFLRRESKLIAARARGLWCTPLSFVTHARERRGTVLVTR